jgi:hypothetical protein
MRSGAGDMLTFGGARIAALHGAPGRKATKSIYEFSFHHQHPEGAHPPAAHTAAGEAASVAFSYKHLADVLCAAFSTMQAMKGCLQTVQSKSEAFKTVQRSSKADGQYSKEQIAASISKCRPVSVTNAQELLSWLKVRAVEYQWE